MAMAGGPADPDSGAGCLSNAFVVRMRITLDDVTPTVTRLIEVPLAALIRDDVVLGEDQSLAAAGV